MLGWLACRVVTPYSFIISTAMNSSLHARLPYFVCPAMSIREATIRAYVIISVGSCTNDVVSPSLYVLARDTIKRDQRQKLTTGAT